MPGYNSGRSFTYGGSPLPVIAGTSEPISFFSYPNPARGVKNVTIKYQFSGPASNVRLDIYSITGFVVYSMKKMGNPPEELTGSYPSWNEHNVSVENGPGVYRCRLEAISTGKHSRFWKWLSLNKPDRIQSETQSSSYITICNLLWQFCSQIQCD